MREQGFTAGVLGLLVVAAGLLPAFAGDSLYGTVTAVESGEVVTFDYGAGQYELRLIGVDVPRTGAIASQARNLVSDMVLGKNARMRFELRNEEGEMLSRLFTDDPVLGIKEVAVELVRAGLAQREQGFDFKYGELAAAEREARAAGRGLWAGPE